VLGGQRHAPVTLPPGKRPTNESKKYTVPWDVHKTRSETSLLLQQITKTSGLKGRKNADSCSLASHKKVLKWLETLQFFPKHSEDILWKQRDVTVKASSLEKESCQTPLRVDCNWISDLANQISWWRKGWNKGDEDGRVERNIGEDRLQKQEDWAVW